MDQMKIGSFLKSLRREKGLTQEQVAEEFNVSRRTVTRWETGANLPDLAVLVEIADFYCVELRELFNGERKSEQMDNELKATVKQAAEYTDMEKKKTIKAVTCYLIAGIVALTANLIFDIVDLGETFWAGFAKGSTAGMALCALILALLFVTGKLEKISCAKTRG